MAPNAFIPNPYLPGQVMPCSGTTQALTNSLQKTLTLSASTGTKTGKAIPVPAFTSLGTFPSAVPLRLTSSLFPSAPAPAGAKQTVVVWFRCDLRLHDHPALTHAIEEAGELGTVLPVFIFDSRAFGKTSFGFEKTGRHRAKFLIESVTALRKALQRLGSDLLVRIGHAETELPALCRAAGAHTVLAHTEVSLDDAMQDGDVETALQKVGVDFTPLWANTLYEANDLPFTIDEFPDAYARFREAVQNKCLVRRALDAPERMPRLPASAGGTALPLGDLPTLAQLGLTALDKSSLRALQGGEQEALAQLQVYVRDAHKRPAGPRLGGIRLGTDFSCNISPWLSLGCISPRRIYRDVSKMAAGSRMNGATQTTVYFELVWRDFFRYITTKYNRASRRARAKGIDKRHGVGRRRVSRTLVGAGL